MVRLRLMAGKAFLGKLLDCFSCSSLWIAIPLALWLGAGIRERVLLTLAFSGGAVLLERATNPASRWPVAHYREDEK